MKLFGFFALTFAQENLCPGWFSESCLDPGLWLAGLTNWKPFRVNTEPGYCDDMLNLPSHLPYQRSCDKFIQCDEYGWVIYHFRHNFRSYDILERNTSVTVRMGFTTISAMESVNGQMHVNVAWRTGFGGHGPNPLRKSIELFQRMMD